MNSSSPSSRQSPPSSLPNPPGKLIQYINTLLHDNINRQHGPIISYIFYMLYWCIILCIITPIITFLYLPMQCILQILYYILSYYHIIPNTNTTYDLVSTKNNNKKDDDESVDICIVITGCDTGFGNELAYYVANELGYTVFAGCLHPQQFFTTGSASTSTTTSSSSTSNNCMTTTKNGGCIIPILMDVTNIQHVSNVVQQVQLWLSSTSNSDDNTQQLPPNTSSKRRTRVLHALINNAGVGRGSIFDWSNIDDKKDGLSDHYYCMDVNYFGMIRCCKAFLPIFKEQSIHNIHCDGRILNLTSMAGYISNGTMGMSAYTASKHAANAFSHILRTELIASYNIQVCTINPSFHKTPLVDTMDMVLSKRWDKLDPKLKEEYGEEYYHRLRELCVDIPQRCKWDMDVVIQQVLQCLRRKHIPPEIIVGTDAKYILMILRMMPYHIIDFIVRYCAASPIPAIMKTKKKKTTVTTNTM